MASKKNSVIKEAVEKCKYLTGDEAKERIEFLKQKYDI